MGTQQILMIILSVIVVGAAVAVAIQQFNTQQENHEKMAAIADMLNYAAQAKAWYQTPTFMGGAGRAARIENGTSADQYTGATVRGLVRYLNPSGAYAVSNIEHPNGRGEYQFQRETSGHAPTTIQITWAVDGKGMWTGALYMLIDLSTGAITMVNN